MELRDQVPELSGGGFFGGLENFVRAPTEDILSLMPSRLKAEELDDFEFDLARKQELKRKAERPVGADVARILDVVESNQRRVHRR